MLVLINDDIIKIVYHFRGDFNKGTPFMSFNKVKPI
jgi:hypothetical protein